MKPKPLSAIDRTKNPPKEKLILARSLETAFALSIILLVIIGWPIIASQFDSSAPRNLLPRDLLAAFLIILAVVFVWNAERIKKPLPLISFSVFRTDYAVTVQIPKANETDEIKDRLRIAAQHATLPKRNPEQAMLAALETDLAELDVPVCRIHLMEHPGAKAATSGIIIGE